MELPAQLKSGEAARLFPVISESSKEQRATSIFLSVLSAVPPFADAILSQIGQRVGARTSVNTFTEVVFSNDEPSAPSDRPDGLIELKSSSRTWSALVETKIGPNCLNEQQIERYLKIARANEVSALITISNEFAPLPRHHPVTVQKMLLRKVDLFHFSWTSLLTTAVLLHEQNELEDSEQAFLIREFVRFLSHKSAGLSRYSAMPSEWNDAIEKVQGGGQIPKKPIAEKVVSGWHQEVRDLTLMMTRVIGCPIELRLPRQQQASADERLKLDVENLCQANVLEAEIDIPDAAGPMSILADLRGRVLRVSMTVKAPKDRKSNRARVNWLLRQIEDLDPTAVTVGLVWNSRAATSIHYLDKLRAQPELADQTTSNSEVRAFEISLSSTNAQRFTGRRTVIDELEQLAPRFYETIGQHLRAWKAPPPKPKHSVVEKPRSEPKLPAARPAGNDHDSLLDIPDFLRRVPATD